MPEQPNPQKMQRYLNNPPLLCEAANTTRKFDENGSQIRTPSASPSTSPRENSCSVRAAMKSESYDETGNR
eukprot:10665171-Karenia_brevis.AAC.1